jgi:mannose-6-phosphate isomerase-like protein (cupin superfamily)
MQVMSLKLPGPYATFYTSDHVADEVKEHTHEYAHSCTVVRGSVLAICEGKEKTLAVGQSVIFPKDKAHSIRPLSVDTIFVNACAEVLQSEEPLFRSL